MVKVILIDKNDKVLSLGEKFKAHQKPFPLHRAISVAIFNKDKTQTLIQKRSAKKPTWPYFWSNSVCSHPKPNETYQKAARRRLKEELGFKTPLKKLFSFTYKAIMDNGIWGEHELDYVFAGTYEGPVCPNPDEVAGYEWVKISDLKKDIRKNPEKFTPWFRMVFNKIYAGRIIHRV